LNAGWVTTFNEYVVVSENRVTPVPRSVDKKSAPLLGCAVTTALGIIKTMPKLRSATLSSCLELAELD
jgi:S-(hydroxymethyl)glutathione dehydrogenase/alcohol dehydrogenase